MTRLGGNVVPTTGLVVTWNGEPVWIGNPDTTDSPTIRVYEDYTKARRALYRMVRANRYFGVSEQGYAVSRVRLTVEEEGPPVTIKFREDSLD